MRRCSRPTSSPRWWSVPSILEARSPTDAALLQYSLAQIQVGLGVQYLARGEIVEAHAACRHALTTATPLATDTEFVDFLHTHAMALLCLGRIEEAQPIVARLDEKGWCSAELTHLRDLVGLES